ncbi:MAG: tetratricopeptide repeat protein [Deltaproteobacteria bacterium]|nr:tetratricopeptide repeat protein [Deltaproteobacteria bacterium]
MAKLTARRKSMLDNPEEVFTLAQRLLEQAKLYWKWLALGLAVVVIALAAWFINAKMQADREAQAAVALAQVRPTLAAPGAGAEAAKALEQVVREHPGTTSAREAQLLRANLLYQMKNYAEAAKAYQALLPSGDPVWDALIEESLSYGYEGLGDYQKAAAALKGVEGHLSGPLTGEITQRLALLLEKAGDFKEAAVYWQKLINEGANPAVIPYLKEKLAAAEAKGKK